MKFIVDLRLYGYKNDKELELACIKFIQESLNSYASSVSVEKYDATEIEESPTSETEEA